MRRPTPQLPLAPSPALPRRRLAVALCAAQVLVNACVTTRPVSPGGEPVSTPLRVRFAVPRAVTAVSADGDSLAIPGLPELTGQLMAARGDTLVLRVQSLTPEIDRAVVRRDRVVRVVRQPGDRVEVRRLSPGRTAGLVLGSAAVVAIGTVLYAILTYGIGAG